MLCQVTIWAIALWLWMLSNPDSLLHTNSYLLMLAAQLTIALNLNPFNKFDGYYILESLSRIDHLRQRAFQFYDQIMRGEPSLERQSDRWILAAYAPCSLIYIVWIFGHLLLWIGNLVATNLK